MKIETKYNIGDEVWYMEENYVKKDTVKRISTFHSKTHTNISYYLSGDSINPYAWVYEDKLFPTKEELLKSL